MINTMPVDVRTNEIIKPVEMASISTGKV